MILSYFFCEIFCVVEHEIASDATKKICLMSNVAIYAKYYTWTGCSPKNKLYTPQGYTLVSYGKLLGHL